MPQANLHQTFRFYIAPNMTKYKISSGFTLIETIIYIALLSIIMSGALITSYQLIDGASTLDSKATTQEEGNFVLRKINWALTGAQVIATPIAGCNSALAVSKYDGTSIAIRLSSGKVEISESGVGGAYLPITTENASTTCLKFQLIGLNPVGITATTTINGIDFVITKYIRK